MNLCGKLGLGTVQWGQAYGVANAEGRRPDDGEIGVMLGRARAAGVDLLDTAQVYGEAETIIGRHAGDLDGWRIVTKAAPVAGEGGATGVGLTQSLGRLQCAKVYGLLLHRQDDLTAAQGSTIWSALQRLKSQGLVAKIGVSVYDPEQLERIFDQCELDLVQLPFNLYDQRFLRAGWFERLHRTGVEVHARSAFLQGLLLMTPKAMPARFAPWSDHHRRLYRVIDSLGVSVLAASLRFCLQQPGIDRVIVGCETPGQLDEILQAAAVSSASLPEPETFALDDGAVIDPRRWPRH
jgi:aryl-alcohol dehydrogenase-like predicted oxidoreductase